MAQADELDALGSARRAQVIGAKLTALQQQQLDLEVTQIANDASDGDPAPGVPPKEDGEPTSYKDQRAKLKEAEEKIKAKYKKLMPLVETFLKAQNDSADAQAGN